MFKYEAPDPYSADNLFSFNSVLPSSESIGGLVLPAQWREPANISQMTLRQFADKNNLKINGGYVATFDGAVIDTIALTPKSEISAFSYWAGSI